MGNLKRVCLLIIILAMTIGVCGCTSESNANQAEETKNIALEYLNKNYDDSFTALSYSDGDWAYDYSTVKFTSKKYNDTVDVRVYEAGGIYTCKDNYFKFTMNDDAEEFFKKIAAKCGYASVEVKVRFISLGMSDIDAYKPFSEYVTNGKCNIEVYFISNTAFAEKDIKSILNDICGKRIMGNFRFVETDDENLLARYSISEMVNEKFNRVLQKKSYSINSHFEVVE